ncbi:hypothetical protein [Helicobacter sp. 11S02596-1]|uniref:hypothetical protein n=1 Tax=Helicobacter sp. 11S02596-1 TaxID=1476194 RepID=UPI000BA7BEF4|nr:hypothetical protein [Helicobacter sp. 11S02596-1]PAF44476.1 hypothetical protein BJI48_02845 [Helicobacter sp. 11S02596-1]
MTLVIENIDNVDKNFLTAIKSIAKLRNYNVRVEKEPEKKSKKTQLDIALEEIERGEVITAKTFEEFKRKMEE